MVPEDRRVPASTHMESHIALVLLQPGVNKHRKFDRVRDVITITRLAVG
jgi:hypothetical protein